jgi:hypothetical protein
LELELVVALIQTPVLRENVELLHEKLKYQLEEPRCDVKDRLTSFDKSLDELSKHIWPSIVVAKEMMPHVL